MIRHGRIFGAWAILILIGVSLGASPPQEETGKQAEMEKIQSLLDDEQYKDALKALKIYLRKHAKTPEEKEEVKGLIRLADGSIKFEKIREEFEKRGKARRCVGKIGKFLREYADNLGLVEKGEAFREELRSKYVLVLEDFEDWEDEKQDDGKGNKRRGSVVQDADPEFVKHGRHAGRWDSSRGGSAFWFNPPVRDWSEYDFFCFWLYNGQRKGKWTGHIRIIIKTPGGSCFTSLLAVDWRGWKEIRLPFRGKKGLFARQGQPDWTSIEEVHMLQPDMVLTPMDVFLDDIRLEKDVK